MKRLLITGGSGFIGRNLVEGLSGGYLIEAPLSKELDLLDTEEVAAFLRAGKFDAVIHAATWNATRNSEKDLTKVLENNLRMFFNIARCEGEFGKMLYYGSGAEFGRRHWRQGMKEDYFDSHLPDDQYGLSKYIMARQAEKSQAVFNLRLFGVFGKYEDWEIRFLSNACCKAVWDLPVTLRQNALFDYMHVDDLVRISSWFIENSPSRRIYNVCTGRTQQLLALAEKILGIAGKELPVVVAGEGLATEYGGDNSLLLEEMGGYTFRNMDDCLVELYRFYEERKDSIDRNRLLRDK